MRHIEHTRVRSFSRNGNRDGVQVWAQIEATAAAPNKPWERCYYAGQYFVTLCAVYAAASAICGSSADIECM